MRSAQSFRACSDRRGSKDRCGGRGWKQGGQKVVDELESAEGGEGPATRASSGPEAMEGGGEGGKGAGGRGRIRIGGIRLKVALALRSKKKKRLGHRMERAHTTAGHPPQRSPRNAGARGSLGQDRRRNGGHGPFGGTVGSRKKLESKPWHHVERGRSSAAMGWERGGWAYNRAVAPEGGGGAVAAWGHIMTRLGR